MVFSLVMLVNSDAPYATSFYPVLMFSVTKASVTRPMIRLPQGHPNRDGGPVSPPRCGKRPERTRRCVTCSCPCRHGADQLSCPVFDDVIKNYNGLLICREGRQVDCISPRWTRLQTYDYKVKIEIDFDPILDEHFGHCRSRR